MHSLRSAYRVLASLSRGWAPLSQEHPHLSTDIALTIAGARLIYSASCFGVSWLDAAPAGLERLWEAAARIQLLEPKLIQAAQDTAAALTPHELGIFYEASLHPTVVSKEGRFYTPQWLAEELTSKALKGTRGAVLDPACGGGAFLLAALGELLKESTPTEALQKLYGVDKDQNAAAVCRAALLCSIGAWRSSAELSSHAHALAEHIRHADALFSQDKLLPEEISALSDHSIVSWVETFAPLRHGGFAAVIGNPPYGLSRGEKITAAERAALQRLYRAWISGKINKYLLFIARGYELLQPGGRLGYVVPNSWLGIANATALRKRLFHDGGFVEICDFSQPLFETAGVEVVTLIAQKNAGRTGVRITRQDGGPKNLQHSFEFPTPLSTTDCTIPLHWSKESDALLTLIAKCSIPLGDAESPVIPRIALQAYATGKGSPPQTAEIVKLRPFDCASKDSPDAYPYYQGGDIDRYQLRWSGGYLRHGPFLAEPQELSRFMGPRIIIREILGSAPYLLRATFIEDTALYNKSVLHITAKPLASRDTVLALLGILNSKLGATVIQQRGKKSQRRLFPKVLNADLKAFPIPFNLEHRGTQLANLVKKRLVAARHEVSTLEEQIENAVLDLYGLEPIKLAQIATI
ncbi:MAG: hypothetical protein EBZ48_04480 [Proteobacteria bacterium]|nr:hypothetical protein [Pseudomonadota bacterium]